MKGEVYIWIRAARALQSMSGTISTFFKEHCFRFGPVRIKFIGVSQ